MAGVRTRTGLAAISVGLVLIAGCTASGNDGDSNVGIGEVEPTIVSPDLEQPTLVVNITLSDDGFEPETVFLPAGRHIRMVVRNISDHEHHYRVGGLLTSNLGWYVPPTVTEDEIASMSPEELEDLGMTEDDLDDVEHLLHHLQPTFVPFKEESPAGIRPLPNEVHAYAYRGHIDTVTFFPLSIGEFVAEDVLHPELTGRVIVFDAGT